MHPVSCTDTHHDVTDLLNHGMVKNAKTWISWEWNIAFLWNKNILNLWLRWHSLRCYRFVAKITFKGFWSMKHEQRIEAWTTYEGCSKFAIKEPGQYFYC